MRQVILISLLFGGLAVATGVARGQTYSSYVTGTQIHATANHWGNSPSHHLIDTVTIAIPVSVSKASWTPSGTSEVDLSKINIYDAGLHCLLSPGPELGGCEPGMLYTHTGPLLSSQTNPRSNRQVSVSLVADQNTVCRSYPCTLPIGTYSLTTASSEIGAKTMGLWSDGSFPLTGGADFHIGNSFGVPENAMIAGYVQEDPGIAVSGGNTQVTLTVTMLDGQAVSDSHTGFGPGMRILVEGLTSGIGGPSDPCNGFHSVDANVTTTTITYTISGAHTCTLDGKTDGTETCDGHPDGRGAQGYGCVGAGLPPMLDKVIADQQNPDGQFNGYYCYLDGPPANCQRDGFVGPSGPQSGAHSVGIMIY